MPRYYSYVDTTVGFGSTTVDDMISQGSEFGVVPSIDIVARNITATGAFIGTLGNSHNLFSDITVTGIATCGVVTGAIYYGDGSNLTGIDISGSGANLTDVNATTLDSIDSGSFLRSDTDDDGQGFGSRGNLNSTGDSGLLILNGSRLGFDQSGTRSWTVKASGGNLNVDSGDGVGSLTGQINASTLDSIDSSSFLRSDADDTYSGNLTINGFLAPTGTNVTQNLKLRGGTTASTDAGISIFNGSNNWVMQLYGHNHASTPSYGFLNSNWGGWDLRKYVDGELQVRVGGSDYTVWHSGNDGSGSALDADLLDGYHVETGGRNENADRVVKTDSNGYLLTGWINTTSGDNSSAIPNRMYCSDDGYLRYVDLASFRSLMNVTAKTGFQGREQQTSDTNYWVGTMGWGNNDFNTVSHYGSGHIEGWSSPGNQPSTQTSHWVGHQSIHYTNGSNVYGHQFLVGAGNPAYCYLRGVWGGTYTGWATMWNSSNDGSGSGLDADTLDGLQGSDYVKTSDIGSISVSSATNIDGISFRNGNSTNVTSPDNVTVNGTGYINSISLYGQGDGALYSQAYSTSWVHQIYGDYRTGNISLRGKNNGTWQSWRTVWNSGNDGSGSGLDADTLDGIQGASFLRSDTSDTFTGTLSITGSINNSSTGGSSGAILGNLQVGYGAYYNSISAQSDNSLHLNYNSSGGVYIGSSNAVWHAGNDGSGSGLDADTLDGVQGSNYMGKTGNNYWNANTWIEVSNDHGLYWPNNYAYHLYLDNQYLRIRNNSTSNGIKVVTGSANVNGYFYADSTNQIGILNNAGSWSLRCDNNGNATATGNLTAYSDVRLKENIRTVDGALDKVKAIRGVYFDRKDTGESSMGVIAQEIEEVLPEVVQTQDARSEKNPDALQDLKTVSYGNMVGLLIEAIKDQQKEIEEMRSEIQTLKSSL